VGLQSFDGIPLHLIEIAAPSFYSPQICFNEIGLFGARIVRVILGR
jgi:hypothetical protein